MKAHLTLAFALLLLCSGAALAQTPDDQTPAEETVCNSETGAAYGLCNAFCEAMDCETDTPSASATACDKVRTKFQQIAGHDVPCVNACPCTRIPEFNATLANAGSWYNTTRGTGDGFISISPSPVFDSQEHASASEPHYPGPNCEYRNRFTGTYLSIDVTPEQATACVQLLRDVVVSRGLTCGGFPI
jgi:hypothetical protein